MQAAKYFWRILKELLLKYSILYILILEMCHPKKKDCVQLFWPNQSQNTQWLESCMVFPEAHFSEKFYLTSKWNYQLKGLFCATDITIWYQWSIKQLINIKSLSECILLYIL